MFPVKGILQCQLKDLTLTFEPKKGCQVFGPLWKAYIIKEKFIMRHFHLNFCFVFYLVTLISFTEDKYRLFSQGSLRSILRESRGRPKELTYLEISARIWSCFLIPGAQGPVACVLCSSGLKKQGWKTGGRMQILICISKF